MFHSYSLDSRWIKYAKSWTKSPSTLNDFEPKKLAPNPSSQSSDYRYPIEHPTIFQSLSSAEFNEAKICDKNPQFWRTKPQWFYSRKNPQRSLPKSEIALSIRTLSTQSQKLDQQKWLCVVVDGWWEVEDEESSCVYLSLFLVIGKQRPKQYL